MSHSRISCLLVCLLMGGVLGGAGCGGGARTEGTASPRIDASSRRIHFEATVHSREWNAGLGEPAFHHAITWRGGKAGWKGLFRSPVPDTEILAALKRLGGVHGDNLTEESWTERDDPQAVAPTLHVAGTPVAVSITWSGAGREYALSELLRDPDGRGVEWRFGGHEALIPVWRSGCIVCLQSCPGARISNARYTLRDHYLGMGRLRAREDLLPPDGRPVVVTLQLTGPRRGP